MGRLLISNLRTDDMVGGIESVPRELRSRVAHQAYRTLWCVRAGDVIVLPVPPEVRFLEYLCGITGVDPTSFRIVIPPPGLSGTDLLYEDRMTDKGFVRELSEIVAREDVDEVLPYHFDRTTARLLLSVGLGNRASGLSFIAQGGGETVNSKAVFRAIAAGADVPTAEGTTVRALREAEKVIWDLLSCHGSLILKQDLEVAGLGNEIISVRHGLSPVGARRVEHVADREELCGYLRGRWDWLTRQGAARLVVERYYPDSLPLYVEMSILDREDRLDGYGEMRMDPILNGHIVPGYRSHDEEFAELTTSSRKLCRVLRTMGYRGPLSVDAIVTPDGRLLVSEVNCRQGGPTHIHELGRKIFGPGYLTDAVLSEDRKKRLPPLDGFVAELDRAGIHYDSARKEGVVVTLGDVGPRKGFGEYCVIGPTASTVEELERQVARILSQPRDLSLA
jgi:hypothetical protein